MLGARFQRAGNQGEPRQQRVGRGLKRVGRLLGAAGATDGARDRFAPQKEAALGREAGFEIEASRTGGLFSLGVAVAPDHGTTIEKLSTLKPAFRAGARANSAPHASTPIVLLHRH